MSAPWSPARTHTGLSGDGVLCASAPVLLTPGHTLPAEAAVFRGPEVERLISVHVDLHWVSSVRLSLHASHMSVNSHRLHGVIRVLALDDVGSGWFLHKCIQKKAQSPE